jgi:hypothetical protein
MSDQQAEEFQDVAHRTYNFFLDKVARGELTANFLSIHGISDDLPGDGGYLVMGRNDGRWEIAKVHNSEAFLYQVCATPLELGMVLEELILDEANEHTRPASEWREIRENTARRRFLKGLVRAYAAKYEVKTRIDAVNLLQWLGVPDDQYVAEDVHVPDNHETKPAIERRDGQWWVGMHERGDYDGTSFGTGPWGERLASQQFFADVLSSNAVDLVDGRYEIVAPYLGPVKQAIDEWRPDRPPSSPSPPSPPSPPSQPKAW